MKQIIRYLKIYKRILELAAMLLVEWRAGFLIWTIVHALELAVNLAFFGVILGRTPSVGGWGVYEVVILLGYMEFLMGVGGQTFYPMMYEFGEKIRRGDLDFILTKPVDAQFLISFPWTDVSDLFSLVTGILMMGYGVLHLNITNLWFYVIAFILTFTISLVILYSMLLLLLTVCFKTTKFDALSNIYWTTISIGKFPVSVYKGVFHTFIMFVVPVGLVTAIPAHTLAGFFDIKYFAYSILLAIILFTISRKVFMNNIKRYSSASS